MAYTNRESVPCYHGLRQCKCLLCFPNEDKSALRPFGRTSDHDFVHDSQRSSNLATPTRLRTNLPLRQQEIGGSQAHSNAGNAAWHSQLSGNVNFNVRQQLSNASLPTSLLPSSLQLYAQSQLTSTHRPYNPHPNTIGAEQTYSMNRLLDEPPDFRARGILFNDAQADAKNLGHRAALGTRMKRLDSMIEV